jgi:hypothetical protein
MTTIENYATGDAMQVMVSTNGKTLYGKNRGLGSRTRQIGGHLSDASLQQLSRDMSFINSQTGPAAEGPPAAAHTHNQPVILKANEHHHNLILTPAPTSSSPASPGLCNSEMFH